MLARGIFGKRMMATILVCVMAVTAIAPFAVGSDTDESFEVVRRPPGAPSVNTVWHEWTAPADGQLYLEVQNHGLASVTIAIRDNTTSTGVLSQTIRFQGDGSALINSQTVDVAGGHDYGISAVPGGPPEQYAELTLKYSPSGQPSKSITYKIYDMFEEEWGAWWDVRVGSSWDSERLITDQAGEVTYLYSMNRNPTGDETDQGLIYAPYRWAIEATGLTSLNVHNPVIMPTMGPTVSDAEASADVYFQYLDINGGDWLNYWISEWGSTLDWQDGSLWSDSSSYLEWVANGNEYLDWNDGYMMATYYSVTMNRQAAEEWLAMPQDADPASWWSTNKASYIADWDVWIEDQGNNVFDIYCGYEWPFVPEGTMMRLDVVGDDVVLEIGHFSQGYEALMTRWLRHTGVSMHQPYMEDFTMTATYAAAETALSMDAVAQWSMHCVKQHDAVPETGALSAWVWEPIALDYVAAFGGHPSDYTPYSTETIISWECGDVRYGGEASYVNTPVELNLDVDMKIEVVLPAGDVLGYYAQPVDPGAILRLWSGDTSDYEALKYYGPMSVGYMDIGGGSSSWNSVTRTLTVTGPTGFAGTIPLDHGYPWLEFNVG